MGPPVPCCRLMTWSRDPVPAPLALPCAAAVLLAVGALAAEAGGAVSAGDVLVLVAAVVGLTAAVVTPGTSLLLAADGWLTAVAFAGPPYAELRAGAVGALGARAAVVLAAVTGLGLTAGALARGRRSWPGAERTLDAVYAEPASGGPSSSAGGGAPLGARRALGELAGAVDARRRWLGTLLAVGGLPLVTALLLTRRTHLSLADDLLVYLLLVVAVSAVGGFWPAVLTAVSASLLLNWYFTEPLHTLTIQAPENLLALLLFVCAAISVSSVVHLAARRAAEASRSSAEATALLDLARAVLGSANTPAAVLEHVGDSGSVSAALVERVGGRWVRVAASGEPLAAGTEPTRIVAVREDLRLHLFGDVASISPRVLAGLAAQAAAALDRERLRVQAAQAEVLGEANRVRTALLTAVSHDLRTPLASVKAAVSSLRQRDVAWSPEDEQALLATVEDGADRLDALISNLLDMSRVQTGSLQPFLRPTALDEVVPLALQGLDGATAVDLDLPDALPLVLTDPGLLERVVANLVANGLRFSPPAQPVCLRARVAGDVVVLSVIDHGPGVPEQQREQMFEPFQRLDDRSVGGVGLGLAVARGFVEAMGGSIAATQTPGGGLTMRVELLAATSDASAARGLPA